MELSIIIVSFNTSDLLRKCLNKVYKSLSFGKIEKETEVLVVDNGSTDGTLEMIRKNFPKVEIIKNSRNLGYARANNQAIKQSAGKYILLLNSDTELQNDSLIKLLETIKDDNGIGAAGGKLLNLDKSLQPSAGFFPNLSKVFYWMFFIDDIPFLRKVLKPYHEEDKSFYEKTQKVDWVTGACFLIKKEVVDKVGLLDENIFMYGEEMEWCYRIKKTGYLILYTPYSHIVHHKGASGTFGEGGILEEFKAILYFYKKHKSSWQYPLVCLFLRCGSLLRMAVFGIIGKYPARQNLYAKAFQLVR